MKDEGRKPLTPSASGADEGKIGQHKPTMRGVLRHYKGRVGRDGVIPPPPQPNQLKSQARWTYLHRGGHHPYVPYVNHQHLNSNRSGFTPWIDAPPGSEPRNRLVTVRVPNQLHTDRPVVRVRPRIKNPRLHHFRRTDRTGKHQRMCSDIHEGGTVLINLVAYFMVLQAVFTALFQQ